MTTAQELADYVGAKDVDAVGDAWETAKELVQGYLAGHGGRMLVSGTAILGAGGDFVPPWIPPEITSRAILETGAELFHRKASRNGVAQFATGDSVAPMRISRDPLAAARGILAPYLPTPVGLA